jgi:hypothetical protein
METSVSESGPKLKSLDETEEYVNALYYGDPGSGKTTGAMHMAKLGRVIVVDAEAGIKKRPLRSLGIPIENIYPYTVRSYADLDALYWQVKAQLDKEPGSIVGTVFDSMTEIQKLLLESIIKTRNDKLLAQAARGKFEVKVDEFDVDREEYGKMTEMVRRSSRRFRDLPCHTAFVCLAKREVDKEGSGEIVYRPALTPAFATDLMGYVDVVAYTQHSDGNPNDRSRFTGLTRPIGRYRGKDRYGALPEIMPNPTFDRIVEYVHSDDPAELEANDPWVKARQARIGA